MMCKLSMKHTIRAVTIITICLLIIILISEIVYASNSFNVKFYTSTNDGYIYQTNVDYNTVWSASSGTVYDSLNYIKIGQFRYPDYEIWRGYLPFFNTSEIGHETTIILAKICLYITLDFSTQDFNIVIQNGMPTYPHDPLLSTDYNKDYYSGNGGSLSTVGLSVNAYNNITLNNTGISWINKIGLTKFCLRSSKDISGTPPLPFQGEWIEIGSSEVTNQRPFLEITWRVEEYDYVDVRGDKDANPNLGSHSNFTTQRFYDSICDDLTENNQPQPYENYSLFSYEQDPNNHISYTAYHCDFEGYWDEDAWFMDDKGVGYLTNYTHDFDYKMVGVSDPSANCVTFVYWISNNNGSRNDHLNNGWEYIAIQSRTHWAVPTKRLVLFAYDGSSYVWGDSPFTVTVGVQYYLRIERNGSTNKLYVFSDSLRETLLQTITLNNAPSTAYRYLYQCNTQNAGLSRYVDNDLENLCLDPLNYRLDLEIEWRYANHTRPNEILCIKTCDLTSENIEVHAWNGTSWILLFNDLTANSWNNISIRQYLTSSNFTIRFLDNQKTLDTTEDSWEIDCSLIRSYGEWYSIETWFGELITRQDRTVEIWYGELTKEPTFYIWIILGLLGTFALFVVWAVTLKQ